MPDPILTARIEQVMERYAPTGYDPASDDMTIPFAIKLAEQSERIANLEKAMRSARNQIDALTPRSDTGSHRAKRLKAAIETIDCALKNG